MPIRRKHCVLAAVLGVCLAASRPAAAGLTVYTSQASFQAATTALADINFNGIAPPGGFVNYAIPTGYTDPTTGTNFTFQDANGSDINITSATYYNQFGVPTFPADTLNSAANVPTASPELITLTSGATAIGFLFSTYDSAPITFNFSNGDSYTDNSPPAFGSFSFIGFTDTASFSSLTIDDPTSTGVLLGDVKLGTAVPEPSSLALFGLGVIGLAALRVRRS